VYFATSSVLTAYWYQLECCRLSAEEVEAAVAQKRAELLQEYAQEQADTDPNKWVAIHDSWQHCAALGPNMLLHAGGRVTAAGIAALPASCVCSYCLPLDVSSQQRA